MDNDDANGKRIRNDRRGNIPEGPRRVIASQSRHIPLGARLFGPLGSPVIGELG